MPENVDVAIIMGSKSDWDVMKKCADTLKEFQVPCEARVLSAHRTPHELSLYLESLKAKKTRIIIAAAGLAAHLGGVIASHTILPVIGVPMDAGSMQGMDALLSMVQMPPGIPVGVMAVGKPGAVNAALFAVEILSLQSQELSEKLIGYRKKQAEKVLNEKLD